MIEEGVTDSSVHHPFPLFVVSVSQIRKVPTNYLYKAVFKGLVIGHEMINILRVFTNIYEYLRIFMNNYEYL